ncbi:MAG: DUF4883 family protein, partial [Solirubrobacterales bacterium]
FFIIPLFFSSCSSKNVIYNINKKPSSFYYTNKLMENIKLNKINKCSAFEMNYYKEIEIDTDNFNKVCTFFNKLNTSNFIAPPNDIPSKPKYMIFFTSDDGKFIANIYNEKYISVYPWDGSYEMDFIDISSISNSNNIYELCNFLYSL